MLFNSHEFIFVFLPVTVIVFFVLGSLSLHRPALVWLILASLFFYGWWEARYLALICFSVVFNFLCGVALAGEPRPTARRLLLALGVTVNLGLIGYYKYAGFLLDSVSRVLEADLSVGEILLPIGISFFTFQQIAYLVDVYRGQTRERNFFNYALFVTFFPQLIAGPIVHHRDVLPQFMKSRNLRPSLRNLSIGGTIFAIGLFKKVVIADNLALVATPVFSAAEAGQDLHFFQAWQGAFAYTFQLYFDFSGYSDMAIGLGRLFGIRLPLNFNSPYKATSIIDFWRRWHMTLSSFLRDYLYKPLGGNRKGTARRYVNVMITMLLGGLWHGAGWTFVVWGGLHGLYVIVNQLWRRYSPWKVDKPWSRMVGRSITMLAVVMAWVPFRAETFGGAATVYRGMLNLPNTFEQRLGPAASTLTQLGMRFEGPPVSESDLLSLLWIGAFLAFVWIAPSTQQLMSFYKPALRPLGGFERFRVPVGLSGQAAVLAWRPTMVWAVFASGLAIASLLSLTRVSEFLYFQF